MKPRERFARALSSISRRVAKLQATEICCGGLTREQFETLRAIEATPDPSMSALSAALHVDVSTMSRNITVLERERYVARARATGDSRVVTVGLTARGRNALETLCCDEQDAMAKIFRRLPAGTRASVVAALELVQSAVDGAPAVVSDEACCAEDTSKRAAR